VSTAPVLVTGAAGFLGAAICRGFGDAGERVAAVVRPGTPAERLASLPTVAEVVECDLGREPERLASLLARLAPRVVVHAAVRHAYAPADLVAETADNVLGTARLLSSLGALAARPRLVAIGSSTEYGRAPGPLAEGTSLAPVTSRGATKAAASLLVLAEHAAGRIEAGVLRPFTVYGPGEDPVRLIPAAIRAALEGTELPLAPLDAAHDLVYVDDVARACAIAARSPRFPGAAWNLCSGEAVSNRRLLEAIERAVGRPLRVRAGALPPRPLDRPDWYGDPSRSRDELGWRATTPLGHGLAACVDFWRGRLAPASAGGDRRE